MTTTWAPWSSAHSTSCSRALRVLEADVRRRVDAILVVERPVVVHPLVERVEDVVQRRGIVQERLFDADAERREHEATLQPLLVHQLEACLRLAVRGIDRLELAERVADGVAGALAAEVLVEHSRAWPPDRTSGSG